MGPLHVRTRFFGVGESPDREEVYMTQSRRRQAGTGREGVAFGFSRPCPAMIAAEPVGQGALVRQSRLDPG